MVKLKCWKIIRSNDFERIYENKRINTELKIRFRGKDDNSVSILGHGRYQPTYLAGGNSKIHDASKSQALKFANKYMKEHDKC